MKNSLLRFKEYFTSPVAKWYSEKKLRGLFEEGIKKGTVTIEKDEEGHPYARMKILEKKVRPTD